MLRNTVPTFLKVDSENDGYIKFIDMIGHYFDEIYNSITQLSKLSQRDESVYEGLSKDLLYDVCKQFGWTLQSGFDSSELWQSLLGTDASGSPDS